MAKRAGAETLAVEVCTRLRADILDGRLSPGERLKPVELGERFGVSLGVMREALGLLAAQDLVRIERNRGFHVVTLSPEALAQLTEARKIIEGAALRQAVEQGRVAWESEVLAAHHRLAREPLYLPEAPEVRNSTWARHHLLFHGELVQACGNAVLLDICVRLSDAAELYRAWAGVGGSSGRDVAAEHLALMEAALAHDADRAVRLLEEHLDRTRAILLDRREALGAGEGPETLNPSG